MAVRRFVKQLDRARVEDRVAEVGAMMAYDAAPARFPIAFVRSPAFLALDGDTVRDGVNLALETVSMSARDLRALRVHECAAATKLAIGPRGALRSSVCPTRLGSKR
jgi:hypothetical protein